MRNFFLWGRVQCILESPGVLLFLKEPLFLPLTSFFPFPSNLQGTPASSRSPVWFALSQDGALTSLPLIPQELGVQLPVSDLCSHFPTQVGPSPPKHGFIGVLSPLGPRGTAVQHSLHSSLLWRGLPSWFQMSVPYLLRVAVSPVFQGCCRHGLQVPSWPLLLALCGFCRVREVQLWRHHYPKSSW